VSDGVGLYCSICMWIREDSANVARAITVINGLAVCSEHAEAASLGQDHRHAVVLAGGRL